ncbi:hypothetical protein PMIN02_001575 [Paraphaeosphaeria minitans]
MMPGTRLRAPDRVATGLRALPPSPALGDFALRTLGHANFSQAARLLAIAPAAIGTLNLTACVRQKAL